MECYFIEKEQLLSEKELRTEYQDTAKEAHFNRYPMQ